MTPLFTASDYAKIHSLVFRGDYLGYKPNVVESPNGDGKLDTEKRYAHVAEKYMSGRVGDWDYSRDRILEGYLDKAHQLAVEVAIAIGVPRPFWPMRKHSALRVLEYNGEAVTNPHKDFDLFTLMLYRNDESCFRYLEHQSPAGDEADYHEWLSARRNSRLAIKAAQKLNSQIHFGEILEKIDPKQWLSTPHEVVASGGPWQYSIVFFAIPDHGAMLPNGTTVGNWLKERMERSRYER
jgi:hypothetical protein